MKNDNIRFLEDTVEINDKATIKELLCSERLKSSAGLIADAATAADEHETVVAAALADAVRRCSCRGADADCIGCGGVECAAIGRRDKTIYGGLRAGSAACVRTCPAGADIPQILEKLRRGELIEACRTLLKYDPLPLVAAEVCGGQCQEACVRSEGVRVRETERRLGEYIAAHKEIFYAVPSGDSRKSIAICGAGAAALSAAFYLRRMGSAVSVYGDTRAELCDYGLSERALNALADYKKALEYMGVRFCDAQDAPETRESLRLELRAPAGTEPQKAFISEIKRGRELAGELNLSFGLKSYLETSGDYLTFDDNAIDEPPQSFATESMEEAMKEAARCVNCGCYASDLNGLKAALLAVDAEIITSGGRYRAGDVLTRLVPLSAIPAGEAVCGIAIPECEGYNTGYLAKGGIGLAYAVYCGAEGRVRDIRLVLTGIAPIPVRLFSTEKALRHKALSAELLRGAAECVAETALRTASGDMEILRELFCGATEQKRSSADARNR